MYTEMVAIVKVIAINALNPIAPNATPLNTGLLLSK